MRERRPGLRIAMRIGRRRARAAGDQATVNAITMALADKDIQSEILARLESSHGQEMREQALGDGGFLDWLIANWDSILKMILDIIKLFG